MEVIDAQLHAWEAPSTAYPWEFRDKLSPEAAKRYERERTGTQLSWIMEAVGVDAALLTSPIIYGSDHRYVFDVAARHRGRFGVVGPLFPATPNVIDRIRTFRDQPWGIGVRVVHQPSTPEPITGDGFRNMFAAAAEAEVPIFLIAHRALRELQEIARDYPRMLMVLDHLGLYFVGSKSDRLAMLPQLLELSQFSNVAVKCTAVPELSDEPYPFADLWPHLHRVIEAFGPQRVMWGTDITQHRGELTYCEAVDYMRRTRELSEADKEWILGKTARTLLRWPADV